MLSITTLSICALAVSSVATPAVRDARMVEALRMVGYRLTDRLQVHVRPSWWFSCQEAQTFSSRWAGGVVRAGFGQDPSSLAFSCPEAPACPCPGDGDVCAKRFSSAGSSR